ncbi:MAG: hypothetical protein GX633_05615, partial [Clostridiales bacterium]|nr:hypothetical protein [Clostridiales bacterium]
SQESHRVNFDEALRNIKYSINNKRNEALYYRLNVSVHNASERDCPKLEDIASVVGTLLPFEEALIDTVPDAEFSRSVYEKYLSSGLLELRARLIAAEDCGEYEKGERITFYHSKIYFNCDEKNGKRDAFEPKSIDDPYDPRRSWYNIERGAREICINIGHAAFTSLAEYPEVQHEYIKEQMLKQYVLLYLAEGKFEMFSEQGESFQEMDPIKASERVIERIESVYYRSIA